MLTTLALIALGSLAGVLSGMLGIGGGSIMVPALILAFGYGAHVAVGISLAVIAPLAIVGALSHHLYESINPSVVLVMSIGAVLGAVIGTRIAYAVPAGLLVRIFGVVLLLISIRMIIIAGA